MGLKCIFNAIILFVPFFMCTILSLLDDCMPLKLCLLDFYVLSYIFLSFYLYPLSLYWHNESISLFYSILYANHFHWIRFPISSISLFYLWQKSIRFLTPNGWNQWLSPHYNVTLLVPGNHKYWYEVSLCYANYSSSTHLNSLFREDTILKKSKIIGNTNISPYLGMDASTT